ncbi:DUF2024 family protein [Pseudobacter ginsenosidimutans]|jgi:hypothetical protein|uniref:Uncharacterized protein DUF2024 n=1 Tax=Pseudobacter ginsenosidimutans TaxID=661488 RepID=A0A4Q7MYF4_9BACT|nr:DUF2024 family protein [Pseudobacter ginsenosidimutans]QEC42893.1 DUF2024 family protein [Pseudobacter ginsenosidimutans]RZS74247.1 uncharacterized protein DUF2024 [Pseudobacter ginsenosidimutans]
MKVSVFDTYVTKKNGGIMHFDILVPTDLVSNEEKVHEYGKQYLAEKGQAGQPLATSECRFCHIEEATEDILTDINRQGYSIIEMQGCNN